MSAQIHTLKTGDLSKNKPAKKKVELIDALIHNVFNRLNVQLLQRVSEMLNTADSSLRTLSENAESEELRCKYLNLMHILGSERSNIDKAFFIAMNKKINSNEQSQDDELALVDEDEMEEMVAVTTMYSNAMNNYGQEVDNLEAPGSEIAELNSGMNMPLPMIVPPRQVDGQFDDRAFLEAADGGEARRDRIGFLSEYPEIAHLDGDPGKADKACQQEQPDNHFKRYLFHRIPALVITAACRPVRS